VTGSKKEWKAHQDPELTPDAPSYVHISSISGLPTRQGQLGAAAELYPDLDESDSILGRALTLLHEADRILYDAANFATELDMMSADDAVQRFSALLPELFVCRGLGDSFATVVLALFHGLASLAGMPVTVQQISEARTSVRWLLKEPFLQYGEALRLVSKLEESGMVTEPPGLSIIGDVLLG
jgi:hypothetical protein